MKAYKFFSWFWGVSSREVIPDEKWKNIDKIDYISILRVKAVQKRNLVFNAAAKESFSWVHYKLNLVLNHKSRKILTVFNSDDRDELFEKALKIKEYFGCKILDCSRGKKIWIE